MTNVPLLDLGPQNRAAGCVDQYHSANGQFRQPLPPGDYEVIVTRGIEFSHLRQTVKLAAGQTVDSSRDIGQQVLGHRLAHPAPQHGAATGCWLGRTPPTRPATARRIRRC